MKNRVIITVEDGVAQVFVSDRDDIEVLVVDYDADGFSENELEIDPYGQRCHVGIYAPIENVKQDRRRILDDFWNHFFPPVE